jgi:hypothetical protein
MRIGAAILCGLMLPSLAPAAPTQEEFFKSINSTKDDVDTNKLVSVALAAIALAAVVAVLNLRRKNQVVPKVINNQSKLLKEVLRDVNLRPNELRQLKAIAEERELQSPLVLLLCPSLIRRTVEEKAAEVAKN